MIHRKDPRIKEVSEGLLPAEAQRVKLHSRNPGKRQELTRGEGWSRCSHSGFAASLCRASIAQVLFSLPAFSGSSQALAHTWPGGGTQVSGGCCRAGLSKHNVPAPGLGGLRPLHPARSWGPRTSGRTHPRGFPPWRWN